MKTVIITGGSRGIGRATAIYFSEKGWRVFFCYKNSDKQTEYLQMRYKNVFPFKADISKENEVLDFFDYVLSECGCIDALVCNAAISQKGLFTDISEKDWQDIFDVNVKGVFLSAKAAASQMIKQKSGKIIAVSSMWGQTGGSCEVAYSASKAAVIGLCKALAKELAPCNITVNCVAPGVIETDMNSCLTENDINSLKEEIPMMRIGTPEDVAKSIYFLAEDASYITGQVLSPNGGIYI